MPNEPEIESSRTFLQASEPNQEERARTQEPLEKAERGDDITSTRRKRQESEWNDHDSVLSGPPSERSYESIASPPPSISPGPKLVCPIDPAHYSTVRYQVGEKICCPEHNVQLVPEKVGG